MLEGEEEIRDRLEIFREMLLKDYELTKSNMSYLSLIQSAFHKVSGEAWLSWRKSEIMA